MGQDRVSAYVHFRNHNIYAAKLQRRCGRRDLKVDFFFINTNIVEQDYNRYPIPVTSLLFLLKIFSSPSHEKATR